MRYSIYCLIWLFCTLFSVPAAQGSSGRSVLPNSDPNGAALIGTVVVEPDSVLANARVRVLGRARTEVTGPDGKFEIRGLRTGVYSLEVEAPGYEMERRNHLELLTGQTVELTIELRPWRQPNQESDEDWARIYALESGATRFYDAAPKTANRHAVRGKYLTDGKSDVGIEEESFHRFDLHAIGAPLPGMRYSILANAMYDKYQPRVGPSTDWLETGNADTGSSKRESASVRATLSHAFDTELRAWMDLGYRDQTTDRYAYMWSRPGYVQAFFDTTQTGQVVVRHGRYSPTWVDSTYQRWEPSKHVPRENLERWELRAGFDHHFEERGSYGFRFEFDRTEFDDRVGNKKAWEYEGDRQSDFWFNYTDRESEPFFVISGDFPRLAWGQTDRVSIEADVHRGDGLTALEVVGKFQYLKREYSEILHPYLTDQEGRIGIRSEYDQSHPHYTLYARKGVGEEDWGIALGLQFDSFYLMEEVPIDVGPQNRKSEWSPDFELFFVPTENGGRASYQFRRGFRQPTISYAWNKQWPYEPRLGSRVPESFRTAETETFTHHRFRYDYTRLGYALSLTGQIEDTNGMLQIDGSTLDVRTRFFEAALSPPMTAWLNGSLRYRLAETETEGMFLTGFDHQPVYDSGAPADWDVRHRWRLAADVGELGNWGVEAVWLYESGRPFTVTPHLHEAREFNRGRLPSTSSFEVRGSKTFRLSKLEFRLLAEIFNLFDSRNVAELSPKNWPSPPGYSDRNYRLYYTETGHLGGGYHDDQGYGDWVALHDPRVFGSPRSVRVGVSLGL